MHKTKSLAKCLMLTLKNKYSYIHTVQFLIISETREEKFIFNVKLFFHIDFKLIEFKEKAKAHQFIANERRWNMMLNFRRNLSELRLCKSNWWIQMFPILWWTVYLACYRVTFNIWRYELFRVYTERND